MAQAYSEKQLYKIAHDNYEILRAYCGQLEREGYWDGPRGVLKQSIFAILDMYVQTMLINLAMVSGGLRKTERKFISDITDINIFEIDPEDNPEERVISEAKRIFESPPILLQLCGLRDLKEGSGYMGLFFDAMLNIMLAMAFLDLARTSCITGFIRKYYAAIEAFLGNETEYEAVVTERYIFMKLCDEALEKSAEHLKMAKDSFKKYLDLCLYSGPSKPAEPSNVQDCSQNRQPEAMPAEAVKEPEAFPAYREVDLDPAPESEEDKKLTELEKLLKELDSLVGLEAVKDEVKSLINLIKVRSLRKKNNLPVMDMSFHMVFTGNPGTGKTTVARLIAGIYRELGLISKGHLIETDRSGLVAGYVGQTAIKVRETVERALGGVLFIDEAYSLAGQGANDFGDEAIETLVKMMEDHRDNLVVIVAGYTDEMQRFLKSNTGLTSRFNRFISFGDYSDDELVLIMKAISKKSGYTFDEDAIAGVEGYIKSMTPEERRDFGNARGIRNMFERIVVNQANRICRQNISDVESLLRITAEDV